MKEKRQTANSVHQQASRARDSIFPSEFVSPSHLAPWKEKGEGEKVQPVAIWGSRDRELRAWKIALCGVTAAAQRQRKPPFFVAHSPSGWRIFDYRMAIDCHRREREIFELINPCPLTFRPKETVKVRGRRLFISLGDDVRRYKQSITKNGSRDISVFVYPCSFSLFPFNLLLPPQFISFQSKQWQFANARERIGYMLDIEHIARWIDN